MPINQKIYNILLSLESLDLYALDQMNILIKNKLNIKTESKYLNNRHIIHKKPKYSTQETIYLLNSINNIIIDHHIKAMINNILIDYSYFYPNQQHLASSHTQQYMHRFQYKYEYFCKNKNNKYLLPKYNRIGNIYHIAIMQLYILNKISIKDGPYLLYKYLKSKENNLSATF